MDYFFDYVIDFSRGRGRGSKTGRGTGTGKAFNQPDPSTLGDLPKPKSKVVEEKQKGKEVEPLEEKLEKAKISAKKVYNEVDSKVIYFFSVNVFKMSRVFFQIILYWSVKKCAILCCNVKSYLFFRNSDKNTYHC